MNFLECYADDLSDISNDNDCNSITGSEDSVTYFKNYHYNILVVRLINMCYLLLLLFFMYF